MDREEYLRRSKELHPDRFVNASEHERAAATRAMQDLNAAYEAAGRAREIPPREEFVSPGAPNSAHGGAAPAPVVRRGRWIVIAVASMLLVSVLVALSGGGATPPPSTTDDLTALDGECLVLTAARQLEDVVDCTRPHDARVVKVVDHGTPCPIWAHETMAGPTQDLCLDTHQ